MYVSKQWDLIIWFDTNWLTKIYFHLPEDQIRVELEARQAIKEKQEAKVKKIKEIAQENNLSIPEEIRKRVDVENARSRCLQKLSIFFEILR